MATTFKPCVVDGCKGNASQKAGGAHGWCRPHYRRWQRHGDPLAGATPRNARPLWIEANKDHQEDGCIIWPFSRGPSGYGDMKLLGKGTSASRAMCIAAHGEPPTPEHEAAHSCGKGHEGCVNPRHLRWATQSENQADRVAHGTAVRGERQGSSKLTAADVLSIRSASGFHREIAARFDVSESNVRLIKQRKTWGWLDDSLQPSRPPKVGD